VSSEAILEIVPEGDPQLLAGLLQAQERIPSGSPRLASGGSANLAFLHIVANVILAKIVVERDFRSLKYQEQLLFVFVDALEGKIEGLETRSLGENGVKPISQSELFFFTGSQLEGLELLIEPPDLVADCRLGLSIGLTKG